MTNGEKIKEIFPNMNFGTLAQDDVIVNKDYSNNDEPQVFIPKRVWNAEYKAISKVIEQEPCEDLMAIHTQGLDECIRCAMCTNSMKSDSGCDGGCVVDDGMYKKVVETIKNQIVPSVTPTRKKGKWITNFHGFPPEPTTVCSECGFDRDFYICARGFDNIKFCPSCGADMRKE